MEAKAKVSMACETERLHANVKLDLNPSSMQTTTTTKEKSSGRNRRDPRVAAAVNLGEETLKDSVAAASSSSSPRAKKAAETTSKEESLGDSVLRIYEYETKMRAQGLYVFMVHKGVTLTRSSGFIAFKRAFEAEWGAISRLITKVETVMVKYDVEVAYMDGGKVAELARDQLSRHSESDILRCVCNEDQVRSTVQLPGRAFTTGTEDSEDLAAAAIQARFRGGRQRQDYHALRQEHRAARVITDAVRVSALQARLARQLVRKRAEENAAFQALQRKFKDEWKSTSAGKRVIVHVPSLSFGEHLRLPIDRFGILQNMQLSRLCDLAHRDVEVVYVAPMALVHEVRTYYEKLLQLRGIVNAAGRLHIVVPENAHRFPEHASLATTLSYSPKALERIRGLVCGKAAFIMPNQVGEEDRMLALALRVPLFAPEPDIVSLYSTKSGAKEIFAEAEVNVPIGAYDIFEEDELYRMLAKLVAANLDVDRWVLKIDDEFAGRGIAVLDMSKFRFVQMARVDRARQTAKSHLGKAYWSRSDVQERARQKLEEGFRKEVRHRIDLQCPSVYPTWADFIVAFTNVGGVVEALPDSLLSSVSVCLAIDPDGFTRLLCTQDKISSRQWPFRTVGFVFPQTAVPHVALRSAAYAVAKILFARGVIGHVSVDFAALMDPNVQSLRLWALGLDLRMTQALSTFRFFDFLLGGHIEDNSGEYKISVISESGALPSSSLESGGLGSNQESQGTPREGSTRCVQKELQTRAFAAVSPLHHPNLSSMTYSHFFNACRRHGISYDLRCAKGTAFELADSLSAGVVGAVSIERDAAQAAIQLQRSFNFMHKFLGAYVQQPAEDQTFDGTCTFSDALAVSKRLTAEIEEQYRQELADQRNIERAQQRLHAHQKQQRRRMRRNEKESSEHEVSERSETGAEEASKVQ
ncbi:IQ domain-containing protein H [Hondaea fermentalgiana]|uniref:IQ domain-containing protein H n=1 Tax=Hondaea fermentalgiana TaxID=2315210 RepID=A0A2R5G6P5_9STRA|nr:IQ domain-containing protein H [Hondaea fermentalgiana]|eukprot:GBG25999.1 IQ domain-containing protein H [Hondaea fermentalgiana]